MSDAPSLSIVIPVYNVKEYLPKCMDSLLRTPGISKTEILLIDDGSTDGSSELVDEYAGGSTAPGANGSPSTATNGSPSTVTNGSPSTVTNGSPSTATNGSPSPVNNDDAGTSPGLVQNDDAGSSAFSGKSTEPRPLIRAIHKANAGPAAARNTGIHEAAGTYIFFCDSDDEIEPVLFTRIIEMSETTEDEILLWDADLLIETGHFRRLQKKRKAGYYAHAGLPKVERTYSGRALLEGLLRDGGGFVATVWLGAYRREFLIRNGLLFSEGLIHEDEFWIPKVYLHSKTVHYVPQKIYKYRMHKGSIMHPVTRDRSDHVASLMKIYPSLYTYYEEVLAGDPLLPLIEGNLTTRYLHMIYKFHIVKYGYGKAIDKKLLWRTSRRLREKIMALGLYVYAH